MLISALQKMFHHFLNRLLPGWIGNIRYTVGRHKVPGPGSPPALGFFSTAPTRWIALQLPN